MTQTKQGTMDDLAEVPAQLLITHLVDPDQDHSYHDPRSVYVERFWTGVLGPSAVWLLRLIAREFDSIRNSQSYFVLDMPSTARRLGLGFRSGRNSALMRTFARCCSFNMARQIDEGFFEVRSSLPPVPQYLHRRLPSRLRDEVESWQRTPAGTHPSLSQARDMAKGLLEMGHGRHETTERLAMLNISPSLSDQATAWAWAELKGHPSAMGALEEAGGEPVEPVETVEADELGEQEEAA